MEMFFNQLRSGYEELTSYVSRYHCELKEMDAIYRFGGWLLDNMAADLESILAYQFVDMMDLESIERMEGFLEIRNETGKTLEERRAVVKARLEPVGKLSATMIRELIASLIGGDIGVDIVFTNILTIVVDSLIADGAIHEALEATFKKGLPAHIARSIIYQAQLGGIVYVGGFLQKADIIEMRQVR